MRRLAAFVMLSFSATPGFAQFFPPKPTTPASPSVVPEAPASPEPRRLPSLPSAIPTPTAPGRSMGMSPQTQPQPFVPPSRSESLDPKKPSLPLPYPESLVAIDPTTVSVVRTNGTWEMWAGRVLLRDFGASQADAEEGLRIVRGLRPTDWGRIGSPRPLVEYGLTNGKAPNWTLQPKQSSAIDLDTVRAEPIRGAWCVRDDSSILLNFGPGKADAEQAAAVARRYGFNRIAYVGGAEASMAVFYSAQTVDGKRPSDAMATLARLAQEQNLTRTAVEVPGVGLVGDRLQIDVRKLEVRKDRHEWVLAHGAEVLGRFGYSELAARDAMRVVRDARFTEFCRVGNPGITFFLVNGKPPTRVPYEAQGPRFDPSRILAKEVPGGWAVCEDNGRAILPITSREDAELAAGVIRAFRFDRVCRVGSSPKASLTFLAKEDR